MNRIYKVLAIVSAIIVLILCAVSYTMFAHKKNTYVESQKENDIKTSILKEAFTITLENDHICILDSMKMREPERLRKVLRDSTLQDKPMFVVRISELHCEECMRFILLKLLRLTKGTEMEKHIVLFAYAQSEKRLMSLFKDLSIDYPVYLVDKVPLKLETYDFPYCFVLYNDGTVSHVFLPDKGYSEISNLYIETLKERYYDSGNKICLYKIESLI